MHGAPSLKAAVIAAVIAWGAALAMLRFLPRAAAAVEQHARGEELEQLQLYRTIRSILESLSCMRLRGRR